MVIIPMCGSLLFGVAFAVTLVLILGCIGFKKVNGKILLIVCIPLAVVLWIVDDAFMNWWASSVTRKCENCDLAEYDAFWPRLPSAASGITYRSDLDYCEAVFFISETEFSSWVKENKWNATSFSGEKDLSLGAINKSFKVNSGIEFSGAPPVMMISGIYDGDKHVCGFHASYRAVKRKPLF